jgi:serine/threonine protein kinase
VTRASVAISGSAPQRRTGRAWRFRPGETIVPGRSALRLLGGGDRYEAYLAWDERLHTPVVAKLLRPHLIDASQARAAIAREAEALESLQHPVLVRLFGAFIDSDRPHIVLEFLDGPRLSTLIRKYGPLAPEQLVPLARQLCSALAFMAGEGWVHLDVKPRNIVMTSSPRLIDLSVARREAAAKQVSRPVGTDAYMAPEQCDPVRFAQIAPPSDVWGLGAALFEALVGRQPFPADGDGRFPQLRLPKPLLSDKAPPALARAIQACLGDDPASRPTASELAEMLEPLADWSARGRRRIR